MAKKSGAQIAGDLAHLAKALYDIIKAFMQGGWGAAALQTLKHYWPQILAIALALILLPIIIFCCLPMIMFGYENSTNENVSSMTIQAETMSQYYDNYELYIDEYVESIESTVTSQSTETDGTTHETSSTEDTEDEVVYEGSKIQKNWFIALHAVSVENNLNAADEADVRAFANSCLSYSIMPKDQNTESETDETETTTMILTIHYLTPQEIMAVHNYTEFDKNWAELIYNVLEEGGTI